MNKDRVLPHFFLSFWAGWYCQLDHKDFTKNRNVSRDGATKTFQVPRIHNSWSNYEIKLNYAICLSVKLPKNGALSFPSRIIPFKFKEKRWSPTTPSNAQEKSWKRRHYLHARSVFPARENLEYYPVQHQTSGEAGARCVGSGNKTVYSYRRARQGVRKFVP